MGLGTVPCGGVKPYLNQFKFKWFNSIQIFPNFDRSGKHFPVLRKNEIKYGFEDLEKMNNPLQINFFRVRRYFE
jgi:hypothetical protein